MSTALTTSRDYLARNRRMLIGRSLAAAVAGGLPVPIVEEWLSSTIKRRTIARIAESHQIDMTDEAIRELADGEDLVPQWSEVASSAIVGRLLSRTWRRLLIGLLAVRRSRVAIRNFLVATLFDHYCARLHTGLGLRAADAADLRKMFAEAIDMTPGGLSSNAVQRALIATAKATARAPLKLADVATGGAIKRLIDRRSEVEAADEIDEEVERQLAEQSGPLARAAFAVELELSAEDNPYVENLLNNFEQTWRRRHDDSDGK